MGFIEEFRQEVESKEKQRLEQQAAEQANKRERNNHAKTFRQESGVGVLAEEFARLLKVDNRLTVSAHGIGFREGYALWSEKENITPHPQLKSMDVDSVFEQFLFDKTKTVEEIYAGYGLYYDDRYYDVYYNKGFLIETRPDGLIVFYGHTEISVPNQTWSLDKRTLENAMEQTFKAPFIQETKYYRTNHNYHPKEKYLSPGTYKVI